MIKRWKKISEENLGDFKIFNLWKKISLSPRNGKRFPFYVLDTRDWINIIPVTKNGKVIMIKQFRHATEEITLEIPGGIVDVKDKSAEESAGRELKEETGFVGEKIIKLGSCTPNPAILNNRLHIFYAHNVRCVSEQKQDGSEDIETIEVDILTIPELIRSGEINHALVIAAFHLFDLSEYSKHYK